MIRLCTRMLRASIKVARIDMTPKSVKNLSKIDFYPVVGFQQQKLGACILNQPANQNILTVEFMEQLSRFLLSYDYDHSVENIFIQSKDAVFSHGLDYKRLSEDKDYLDKAFQFGIIVAKMNKPVFAQVSGGVKGAGAHLLSMLTMPLAYKNTFLKIDDAQRGMVPTMGGSHRLSRLPLKLGFYLALTGDELNFEEMTQLGYVKGFIRDGVGNREIRSRLQQANLYFRNGFKYIDFDEKPFEQQQKAKVKANKAKFQNHFQYRQAEILSKSSNNLNLKFAVNQHLAASADYYNVLEPYNTFSRGKDVKINNYFEMRLDKPLEYLKKHQIVEVFDLKAVDIPRLDLAKIDFIFSKSTLEQIMEALKEEKSDWAEKAYKKMIRADPLALHLTLKLLQKGESLPWISCVENEFTVARRLTAKSILQLKTYNNSSQYVLANEYSQKSYLDVPQDTIDSFFAPAEGEDIFIHNVKPNSLHPYSDYYRILPDSARKYLNQEEYNDGYMKEQQPEVKRFLAKNKINYSSQVYDISLLRKQFFEKIEIEKQKELVKTRLTYLTRRQNYLNHLRKEKQTFLNDISQEVLEQKILQQIKNSFKTKFQDRFKTFEQKTANIIGLENKIILFKKMKDIILDNLIFKGAEYQQKQKNKNLFDGPIYFDSQGRDIYSSQNPNIVSNQAFSTLANDLSKGLTTTRSFEKYQKKQMPESFASSECMLKHQIEDRKIWQLIKFRYDEQPEIWAKAATYKELTEQAARTSEDFAGYLDWTHQNFHDLLKYSEKKKQTYGQFADEVVKQIKNIRSKRLDKLRQMQSQRKRVFGDSIYEKAYTLQNQQQMKQCFPYYFDETIIPIEFRQSFVSVLDSTIGQFTKIYADSQKKLLFDEELQYIDDWINNDLIHKYTETLKDDVEYITSYIQILKVKQLLCWLDNAANSDYVLEEIILIMNDKFNLSFKAEEDQQQDSEEVSFENIIDKLFGYLYFLMDMHSKAKTNIKSPQSKLIDFINRLKQYYEADETSAMPYTFESLIQMIGKDRRRIYDRYMQKHFISEPEFFIDQITKQSKKTSAELMKRKTDDQKILQSTLKQYVDKHIGLFSRQKKELMQSYAYYMIMFEKKIHEICGKQNFLPVGFINKQHKDINDYCQKLFKPISLQQWLNKEIKEVVDQFLEERYEAEKGLRKGQLYLFDKSFSSKLRVSNIKKAISNKLQQQIQVVKNIFRDERDYNFDPTEQQIHDEIYTRTKRAIKNVDALKKANNLAISEQIFNEYVEQSYNRQIETPEESRFVLNERQYAKDGNVSRLPSVSYRRIGRDAFIYPEDGNHVPQTQEERDLFKKTNLTFSKSVTEKIILSNYAEQYKILHSNIKDQILDEMVHKIKIVETL